MTIDGQQNRTKSRQHESDGQVKISPQNTTAKFVINEQFLSNFNPVFARNVWKREDNLELSNF